jgi:hypothetical protein
LCAAVINDDPALRRAALALKIPAIRVRTKNAHIQNVSLTLFSIDSKAA